MQRSRSPCFSVYCLANVRTEPHGRLRSCNSIPGARRDSSECLLALLFPLVGSGDRLATGRDRLIRLEASPRTIGSFLVSIVRVTGAFAPRRLYCRWMLHIQEHAEKEKKILHGVCILFLRQRIAICVHRSGDCNRRFTQASRLATTSQQLSMP